VSQPVPNPPPGFDALSVDEQIAYVESLWDLIVDHSEIPVPEWHRELIRERLDAYRADPGSARPWSEVRAELQRKYGFSSDR
jgi:putative addiction module component (TIGR02574 family)